MASNPRNIETTLKPTPKTTVATLAAALSILVSWLVGLTGVDMPPEVATAFATVLVAVATYFTPERRVDPMPGGRRDRRTNGHPYEDLNPMESKK